MTLFHLAGCTGVKSGTVDVDETDEKHKGGVGGAPARNVASPAGPWRVSKNILPVIMPTFEIGKRQ